MQLLLLLTAALASAATEQQPFRRQIGSNSTLVVVQAAETGILRVGAPSPTDLSLGSNRFASDSGNGYFQVSGAGSTATTVGGLLGVVGAIVGGAMLL